MEIGFFAQWVSQVLHKISFPGSPRNQSVVPVATATVSPVKEFSPPQKNTLKAERALEGEHILALLDRFGSSISPYFLTQSHT